MLRPYQSKAVALARAHLAERPVLCLPTGSGKTVIAAEIVRLAAERGKRTLFLCDRREIVAQTQEKYKVEAGLILAGEDRTDHPHQIAAAQTLNRRALPKADLLIVDECRLSLAPTMRRIVEQYPVRIGLDATPVRDDGKGLGALYGIILEPVTTAELLAGGWLAPYRYFAPDKPSLKGVKRVRGDYEPEGAADAMMQRHVVGGIVASYLKHGGTMLLFACTVRHSIAMRNAFRSAGVKAEHADGTTPKGERERVFNGLRDRSISVVCNVGLVGYGFDAPSLDGVILARPTKSLAVYRQQVGRALRPPGLAVILDHAGNVYEHGMPDCPVTWSLEDGLTRSSSPGIAWCRSCYAVFAPHTRSCPCCGEEREAQRVEVVHHAAEMREVKEVVKRPVSDDVVAFLKQAHQRGFKPRWAQFAYQRQRGYFPKGDFMGAVRKEMEGCLIPACGFCGAVRVMA